MDVCSCTQAGNTGCPNCHGIRFRHRVVCEKADKANGIPSLNEFGLNTDCPFCLIITRAFLRRLESSGRGSLIAPVREGRTSYCHLDARFSLSDTLAIPWGGEKSQSTFLNVHFHQQIVGDSGGDAPLGSALFHIGWGTTPRSLRSSTKSKKYQRPKRFSSLRSRLGASVNWSFLNKWIRECKQNHSGPCRLASSPSRTLGRPARLIDVIQSCVINTGPADEYITLSYVWGLATLATKNMLTAKTSNILSLGEPASLSRRDLPRTILDAMEVCRRIGHRYLWVDALCIVQDDPNDVKEQIDLMCDIYSGSFLTIIAAWGENADAGLPGVSDDSVREPQHVARLDDLEMIEVLPLLGDVRKQSVWMSRAWTHQEWVLSNRRLYFTNVQVYFECAESLHNEDAWVMKTANQNNAPERFDGDGHFRQTTPILPTRPPPLWSRFKDLLVDYTKRHLSYHSDIFNACAGLYHHVYGPAKQGSRLIFGLPERDFHDALRWSSYWYTARNPESVDVILPTWSWASRNAAVTWASRGHSWKRFVKWRENGDVWDEDAPPVDLSDMLKAWDNIPADDNAPDEDALNGNDKDDLGEGGSNDGGSNDGGLYGDDGDPLLIPLIKFDVCLEASQGWTTIQSSYGEEERNAAKPEYPSPISHHIPIAGRLRFRTQLALFELWGDIGYWNVQDGEQEISLNIMHRGGFNGYDLCSIKVSVDWAVKQARPSCSGSCWHRNRRRYPPPSTAREMADEMYPSGWSDCRYVVSNRLFTFALVSAVNLPRHWTISTLESYVEGEDPEVKDEVGSFLRTVPHKSHYSSLCKDLHVILIEENKHRGAARRVGIGEMRLRDWLEGGPVMKDIVME